jgi:hypothetical protein
LPNFNAGLTAHLEATRAELDQQRAATATLQVRFNSLTLL